VVSVTLGKLHKLEEFKNVLINIFGLGRTI
jgi:hypothetical protein